MSEWNSETIGYDLQCNPLDWSGVSGLADLPMVVINLALLWTVWQGMRNIRETPKSRDAEMMALVLEQIEKIKPAMRELNHCGDHDEWKQDEEACKHANVI